MPSDFGVANLVAVLGRAPEAWADLPDPDAFSSAAAAARSAAWSSWPIERLRPGGRLVANVGSIESLAAVHQTLAAAGQGRQRVDDQHRPRHVSTRAGAVRGAESDVSVGRGQRPAATARKNTTVSASEYPQLDVIAVGAHPDDVEIACGGTLAKLVRQGYRVGIIDLTDGEPTPGSPGPEVRLAEAQKAAEALGVHVRVQLDLPNRRLFDTFEARVALAKEFRKYRPRLVLGFGDKTPLASPDHWQAMQITDAAVFYARLTKWDEYFDDLPVHTISAQLYYTLGFGTLAVAAGRRAPGGRHRRHAGNEARGRPLLRHAVSQGQGIHLRADSRRGRARRHRRRLRRRRTVRQPRARWARATWCTFCSAKPRPTSRASRKCDKQQSLIAGCR